MGMIAKTMGAIALVPVLAAAVAGAMRKEEPVPLKLGWQARTTVESPTPVATTVTSRPAWTVSQSTSPIDDSPHVVMTSQSLDSVPDRLGRPVKLELVIRCLENKTVLYVHFGGHFMVSDDYGRWGKVTYRIDKRAAETFHWGQSTDHSALMLGGVDAIAVAKEMLGAKTMLVRATPYNESALIATFNVEGLEDKIKPLRTACSW